MVPEEDPYAEEEVREESADERESRESERDPRSGGDLVDETEGVEREEYTGNPTQPHMAQPTFGARHHTVFARFHTNSNFSSGEVHVFINQKATQPGSLNQSSGSWDSITSFEDITTGADADTPFYSQVTGNLWRLKYNTTDNPVVIKYNAHWRKYKATFASSHVEEFEVLVPGYNNSIQSMYGMWSMGNDYISSGCNDTVLSVPDFSVKFGDLPWVYSGTPNPYQFTQTNIIDNPSGVWYNGGSLVNLSGNAIPQQLVIQGGGTDNFVLANSNGGGPTNPNSYNVAPGTAAKHKIATIVTIIDDTLNPDHLPYLTSVNYASGATLNWNDLMYGLTSGYIGSMPTAGFAFQYFVTYTENLPVCDSQIYTIDGCTDPNNMAYWGYTGTDCDDTAIPSAVQANPSLAIWTPGSCCPDCIHASADDITYSTQPLTLNVQGTNPTTIGGTNGYIDVTIKDGGFDAMGVPQGLPTGTGNYTFVVQNIDSTDTMCGNTAGLGVGSGAVANNSFTFGYGVPGTNNNGGLLQTGATGNASYAASAIQGYVPGGTSTSAPYGLGTTNSEGFREGTYKVYVFDSSSTVCLGQAEITLTDPAPTSGCMDNDAGTSYGAALNYDNTATIADNNSCIYCENTSGKLIEGSGNYVGGTGDISTNSGGSSIGHAPSSTSTAGYIFLNGISPTVQFQAYINNIVDGSGTQNADYMVALYRWNNQSSAGSFSSSTLVGTAINNQGGGWNVMLDTTTVGANVLYGYYSVKIWVSDPDDTVEVEECYQIIDYVIPVQVCLDAGVATTSDGVIISDPNLYSHHQPICDIINTFCCDTPVFQTSSGFDLCTNFVYESEITCSPNANGLTYILQYDNGGGWVDVVTNTHGFGGSSSSLIVSPFNTGAIYNLTAFQSYGDGNYRIKWISSYPAASDCTVYSNTINIVLPYFGCTDVSANNYDALANCDDGSCTYCTYGCTDPGASNYDPTATCDDGSCVYNVYGCTDPVASNYDPLATIDDGSCIYTAMGCTDPLAINYDAAAVVDDGSCIYCDDPPLTFSYTATGTTLVDPDGCLDNCDGSLTLNITSATCSTYTIVDMYMFCGIINSEISIISNVSYSTGVTVLNNLCSATWTMILEDCNGCQMTVEATVPGAGGPCGCTDPAADNYDPNATIDDGSCEYCGCTDDQAINYNPGATSNCVPDTCVYPSLLPPCIPPNIDQVLEKMKLCISENGFDYYNKLVTGLSDDCSIMNNWKLILVDYLLRRRGLDCIYNCADVSTPDPSTVYISCEELWITGGPTTGLNDTAVSGTGVGTTSTVDMFYTNGELAPGDVIKHHNSGNIWIFYGPGQNGAPTPVSVVGLDPENASGNLSGYWGYCNDDMRYISNSNNINYIDNFINFVNTFCRDCGNEPNLLTGSSSNLNIPTLNQGVDGIDGIEI